MVNYSNGKIYKLVDNTNGNIYIGSTCKKLCQRIAQHRDDYRKYLNGKHHWVYSFKILENGNYDIILLEEVKDCESKEQLHARERFHIENNICVNKNIPGRTSKQYIADHKEHYQELERKYNQIKKHCDVCNCEVISKKFKRHERNKKHQNNLLKI